MSVTPRFQEEYSAKIPALAVLANLGFTYLSPSQALELRGSKERVVLAEVLRAELAKRRFFSNGVVHGLSEAALNKLVSELSHPPATAPLYFMALKALGLGMDQVQALVEQVVQIVRAGTRKA